MSGRGQTGERSWQSDGKCYDGLMASPRKPATPRVRIKDVARHARVSVGTVSHVLSGNIQVSAPLRARVEKAIDALGYVPNFHAQRLRHSLSRVIGICLPHTSTAYLNTLSETCEEIASRNGYGVMHVFSRHDPATELDRIKELIRYRVDGLILLPSPTPRDALDFAAKKDVPLVIVDRPTPDARFDQVVLDNRAAMREVASRLVDLGHRHLLFVCRSRSRLVTRHRLAGLADVRRKRRHRERLPRVPQRRRVPARRARAHAARQAGADRARGQQQPPGFAGAAIPRRASGRLPRRALGGRVRRPGVVHAGPSDAVRGAPARGGNGRGGVGSPDAARAARGRTRTHGGARAVGRVPRVGGGSARTPRRAWCRSAPASDASTSAGPRPACAPQGLLPARPR